MAIECLIIGATGMVGRRLVEEARRRHLEAAGVARHGSDFLVDATDSVALRTLLDRLDPQVVLNAAAYVDLPACESDPGLAYRVNTHVVAVLARWCTEQSARFVQVSTDHLFTGDGARRHDESAAVNLLNTYAASKFAAETIALTYPGALVLRTNVTGARGDTQRPTFSEWMFRALENTRPMPLFTDYFTSTLDTRSFASAVFDLVAGGTCGLLNLASRTVSSKHDFVRAVAQRFGRCPPILSASVRGLPVERAESLGLDVSRAEGLLGYRLPDLTRVAELLVAERREGG